MDKSRIYYFRDIFNLSLIWDKRHSRSFKINQDTLDTRYQYDIMRFVSKKEKLIKKLQKGIIKAKELKTLLLLSGANLDRVKGSHEQWIFNDKRLTLATHRKELNFYQIKQAKEFLGV